MELSRKTERNIFIADYYSNYKVFYGLTGCRARAWREIDTEWVKKVFPPDCIGSVNSVEEIENMLKEGNSVYFADCSEKKGPEGARGKL